MGVIARQSIKGAVANYLGVAIGFFVSFFILTRYLTQEEIGLTRVMVDAALLFSSLAQLGTNASIVRFFPWFKSEKSETSIPNHGIFGLSMLVPLAGFSLFALAFLIFRDPLLTVYAMKSPLVADYFYLIPMLTFFALYTTVFETNASVLLRITVPKLVREVGIRLFNLATYLLYGYDLISLDVFVWLFCGSYGLAMVLNLTYLRSLGRISFRIDRGFLDRHVPGKEKLDVIGYRSVSLGFLFLTFTIITGAIWAEQAWGSYWSWDPKETWSLITWLVYAAYLHMRLRRGWQGRAAAIFAMVGFVCVMFTYVGVNTFLPGVHSYA